MGAQRRVTILLTEEQYTGLTEKCGLISMSAYIKSKLFEEKNAGPGKAVQPDGDVHMASGSTSAPERPAKPKSPKYEPGSIAVSVADRTKHEVGCDCFQCVQAERFFRSQREK